MRVASTMRHTTSDVQVVMMVWIMMTCEPGEFLAEYLPSRTKLTSTIPLLFFSQPGQVPRFRSLNGFNE